MEKSSRIIYPRNCVREDFPRDGNAKWSRFDEMKSHESPISKTSNVNDRLILATVQKHSRIWRNFIKK